MSSSNPSGEPVSSPPLRPRTTRTEELRKAAMVKAKAANSRGTLPAHRAAPSTTTTRNSERSATGGSPKATAVSPPLASPPPAAADLFASPPRDDPFDTPVRHSGAHKHFSSGSDLDATAESQLFSTEPSPAAAPGREGSGGDNGALGGFISAFEDDRDEEELEMDRRLASLKRLGEHGAPARPSVDPAAGVGDSDSDGSPLRSAPPAHRAAALQRSQAERAADGETRPLATVSGVNLASVSASLLRSGVHGGEEVTRLLSPPGADVDGPRVADPSLGDVSGGPSPGPSPIKEHHATHSTRSASSFLVSLQYSGAPAGDASPEIAFEESAVHIRTARSHEDGEGHVESETGGLSPAAHEEDVPVVEEGAEVDAESRAPDSDVAVSEIPSPVKREEEAADDAHDLAHQYTVDVDFVSPAEEEDTLPETSALIQESAGVAMSEADIAGPQEGQAGDASPEPSGLDEAASTAVTTPAEVLVGIECDSHSQGVEESPVESSEGAADVSPVAESAADPAQVTVAEEILTPAAPPVESEPEQIPMGAATGVSPTDNQEKTKQQSLNDASMLFGGGGGAARPAATGKPTATSKPASVRPVQAAGDLFGAAPSAAADPFGAPPATTRPATVKVTVPTVRTLKPAQDAAGLFGSAPANTADIFSTTSPPAPNSARAVPPPRQLAARPMQPAGDLFGSSAPGDVFGAPPNAAPTAAFPASQSAAKSSAPPPVVRLASKPAAAAADLFGRGSADAMFGAPGPTPIDAFSSPPTSFVSNTSGDLFGGGPPGAAVGAPVPTVADAFSSPPQSTTSVIASVSEIHSPAEAVPSPQESISESAAPQDALPAGSGPMQSVFDSPPAPATVEEKEQDISLNSDINVSIAASSVDVVDERESAEEFAEEKAPTASAAQAELAPQPAPAVVSAPLLERAATETIRPTVPMDMPSPPPSATRSVSATGPKTLQVRRGGADLFGSSPDLFSSSAGADSLFSTAPAAPTTDIFGAPAPAAAPDPFSAPAPGIRERLPTRGAAAGDVFSREAPKAVEVSIDLSAPPSAPGVRGRPDGRKTDATPAVPPSTTPVGRPATRPAVVMAPNGMPMPATISAQSLAAPPPSSDGKPPKGKQHEPARPRGSSHSAPVPEGMIPTPHGFVKAAPSGGPGHAKPITSPPNSNGSSSGAASNGHYYRFPQACTFARFGFGGKVVVHHPPVVYPSGFIKQSTMPARVNPRPLGVFRLADLMTDGETRDMITVIRAMKGPVAPSLPLSEAHAFIDGRIAALSSSDPSERDQDRPADGERDRNSSERLLWSALRVMLECDGIAHSDGALSPSSPENRLAALLTRAASGPKKLFSLNAASQSGAAAAVDPVPSGAATATGMEGAPLSAAQRAEIEAMLIEGRREEALAVALQLKQFALAMLIGTVCGKEHFQSAVRSYADSCLDSNSALHFMSLLYSNQASSALQLPLATIGTKVTGSGGMSGGGARRGVSWADASPFVLSWRQHLSCVLLNKTSDWVDVVRQLGERVFAETNDIAAAHTAFMVAGSLPSGTAGRGKYSLLGCDGASHFHRNVADLQSVLGLRRSELLEYAILRGREKQQTEIETDARPSSSGLSFGSLFGLGGTASSGAGGGHPVTPPRLVTSRSSGGDAVSAERALRLRVAMCYPKLKFAIWLAELGMVEEAARYAAEARDVVRACKRAAPPALKQLPKTSQDDGKLTPPNAGTPKRDAVGPAISKGFTRALDEFCDRLSGGGSAIPGGVGSGVVGAVGSHSGDKSGAPAGGMWKGFGLSISNALSSSNLKDFVDGPGHAHDAAAGGAPVAGPPASLSQPSPTGPPGALQVGHRPNSMPNSFGGGGSGTPPPPMSAQPSMGGSNHPHRSGSEFNNRPHSSGFSQGGPAPPMTSGHSFNDGSQGGMPPGGPSSAPGPPGAANSPAEKGSSGGNNNNSRAVPSGQGQRAGSSSSSPVAAQGEEGSGGVVTKVRKGLLGWLYPDAKDTSENMGNELKAYFDKNTGKWVFPGEENAATQDPSAGPPPTIGMGSGPSAPLTVPGPSGNSAQSTGDAGDAPYDPLAAMMAPPSRSIPKSTSYGSMPPAPSSGGKGAPPMIGNFGMPKQSQQGGFGHAAASAGPPGGTPPTAPPQQDISGASAHMPPLPPPSFGPPPL